MNQLEQLIREYLQGPKVMQLATVKDGQPWLCTVNYGIDEHLNFYWISLKSRRHSQELKDNPQVAGAVLQDPNIKRCVHFEGTAQAVPAEDLERVHNLYSEKHGHKPERLAEARQASDRTRTYYQFKPRLFVLFDEINFPQDPRQEWKVK